MKYILWTPEPLLDGVDKPLCLWDMLIIGADVQGDIRFRNIGMEWFELNIHFDKSKVETYNCIGLLDCMLNLDQDGNAKILEAFKRTKLQV